MATISEKEKLLKLANYKMPYGKYKGAFLYEIPLAYLLWFQKKGFPEGPLGHYMQQMLEIKHNGLEHLISKIQKDFKR